MKYTSKLHALTATVMAIGSFAGEVTAAMIANISPVEDNTIYQPDNLSNGAGDWLFAGNNGSSASRRALLRFDLVGSGITTGAIINSVTLTLTMDRTLSGDQIMNLHRLTSNWGEGSDDAAGQEGGGAFATAGASDWQENFVGSSTWNTAGGDFDVSASASQTVGGNGSYNWTGNALVSDVQGWLATPASNFGWILIGNESSGYTSKRFLSRENAGLSPQLTIDYTPVPEPSSTALLGLGGLALMLRRRR